MLSPEKYEENLQRALELSRNGLDQEETDIATALAQSLQDYQQQGHSLDLTHDISDSLQQTGQSSQDNYEEELQRALNASSWGFLLDQMLEEDEYLDYLTTEEKNLIPYLGTEDKQLLVDKVRVRQREASEQITKIHEQQRKELEEALKKENLDKNIKIMHGYIKSIVLMKRFIKSRKRLKRIVEIDKEIAELEEKNESVRDQAKNNKISREGAQLEIDTIRKKHRQLDQQKKEL